MDKEKLKNPEYKRMYQVLRERLAKNIARSVLLLLLFNVMLSFCLQADFLLQCFLTALLPGMQFRLFLLR